MKQILFYLLAVLTITSCVTVVEGPGPRGYDGQAFFGVDFDYHRPYGYWDNNRSIPTDPIIGEYYHTFDGIYDFEFYETEEDYWFGTYEIFINYGGPGRPYGEPGRDGYDTYLLLVLGSRGPYEYRKAAMADTNIKAMEIIKDSKLEREYLIDYQGGKMHVKMQKGKSGEGKHKEALKIKF